MKVDINLRALFHNFFVMMADTCTVYYIYMLYTIPLTLEVIDVCFECRNVRNLKKAVPYT